MKVRVVGDPLLVELLGLAGIRGESAEEVDGVEAAIERCLAETGVGVVLVGVVEGEASLLASAKLLLWTIMQEGVLCRYSCMSAVECPKKFQRGFWHGRISRLCCCLDY